MKSLVCTTYRALLKQATRIDASVALRAMLCASPIHSYDHTKGEWTSFEGASDWHESRKAVDSLIRTLNSDKEWYHPPALEAHCKDELRSFVRRTFRNSPFSTQSLNLAFSAVKSLSHTLQASTTLEKLSERRADALWEPKHFSVVPTIPRCGRGMGGTDGDTVEMEASACGSGVQLLVAHPLLPGTFRHAVILVLRKDDSSALGVMVNRPLTNETGMVIPLWSAVPDQHPLLTKYLSQHPVMVGGPVGCGSSSAQALLIFHTYEEVDGAHQLTTSGAGKVYLNGEMDSMLKLLESGKAKPENFVCFLGYSGWGQNQLDGEIERGSWICVNHKNDTMTDVAVTPQNNLVLHISNALMAKPTEPSEEPTCTWTSVLQCLGPSYEQLTRLRSLSKHQLHRDDDE